MYGDVTIDRKRPFYPATPVMAWGLGFCGLIQNTPPPQENKLALSWTFRSMKWIKVFPLP